MASNTKQSPSTKERGFGAVVERQSITRRDYKFITPMRMLDMLWKIKPEHHDLTPSEKGTLSALVTYVSLDGVQTNRFYEAFPTIELLMDRAGLGERTVRGARKTLETKAWVKVQTGKGKGKANHYFINGQKIVDAYNLSHGGDEIVVLDRNTFETISSIPSTIERNTVGLMQGHRRPEQSTTQDVGCLQEA